ncbi:hypothetical protein HNY73_003491 [Argiope bruennichi]|uniref:Uncharacterized protein n=1 Tax=Argiope bruennichi TaxID=94029 RepID=A0A8T0FKS3_ARGBR|nr:hypothetical protein HNY73_003491 [Argiope bruennichi]
MDFNNYANSKNTDDLLETDARPLDIVTRKARQEVQAVNLNKAYNDLKMKNEKMRIGKEIKKEPELKVESISPKQMTNFKTETLQSEPLHLDSASTIKSDNQLPELHLEPINLNLFSEFEMDLDEILQLAP